MGMVIEIGGGTCPPRRRCKSENYAGSHSSKECDDANKQKLMKVTLTEIR